MDLKPIIISAPFGNHFNYSNGTSTLGTFTIENRGGFSYRLWRCFRTLRYSRQLKGWINKLGLPNPGIFSLPPSQELYKDKIISIMGFNAHDWERFYMPILTRRPLAVELNLSCPNINHKADTAELNNLIQELNKNKIPIIAKLPPLKFDSYFNHLFDQGIKCFHCCNTLPIPSGGLSGKTLKQYSLWAVENCRHQFGSQVTIIGGGGIYDINDVYDYRNAGADHFAIASALINPMNWWSIKNLINVQLINNQRSPE